MASIQRFHQGGCSGQTCEWPWRLDYCPKGTYGSRQRVLFPTRKAAEEHLAETSAKAARELRQGEDEGGSNDDTIRPDAILSPDEIRVMLNAATPGLYRTLFTTAALTSARSGELFALRWGDIEIPKDRPAYIDVRRTVSWARINGEAIRPRFYPPKTKAGLRKIPIPAELAAALRVWKLQCPATADELVFPAADGRPIQRSNALRHGLWSALRRAGLDRKSVV